MESVAAFAWNGWQASSGISGNLGLEYANEPEVRLLPSSLIKSTLASTPLPVPFAETGLKAFQETAFVAASVGHMTK